MEDPFRQETCNNTSLWPVQSRNIKRHIRRSLHTLQPSFWSSSEDDVARLKQIDDTAWLNGLRGLAAVVVFNNHVLGFYTDLLHVGFGAKDRNPFRLPMIHVCYDGWDAVCIFFILSGYVCSLQTLRKIHSGLHDNILKSLGRSIFRRAPRLFLPVFAISFINAVAAYLGLHESYAIMAADKTNYFPGPFKEDPLIRQSTLVAQIDFWFKEMLDMINPWGTGMRHTTLDFHLWTIQFEYRASMYLYLTLMVLIFIKPNLRLCALIGFAMMNVFWRRTEMPMFFGGAAIALYSIAHESGTEDIDCDIHDEKLPSQHNPKLPLTQPARVTSLVQTRTKTLRLGAYILALWAMSFPISNPVIPAPGFTWLNHTIPDWWNGKDKFPKMWGSILLVFLLATSANKTGSKANPIHLLSTTAFAQYMGRIMFAFYLVHGPILHIFGYRLPHMFWRFMGTDAIGATPLIYALGVIFCMVPSFAVCIWAADLFNRVVETRCVTLAKKIEDFLFVER